MKHIKSIVFFILLAAIITFFAFGFSDANTINDASDIAKHRIGCKCCDGKYFRSIFAGACLGHGGIKYWKYSNGTREYTGNCK